MDFQSPYASLGQLMFTPGQTAQAGSQLQNQLAGQYNPRMTLKNQASNTGIQRSLTGALKGQGRYDAARQLSPLANKFNDASTNAQHGLNLQRLNEGYGTSMLNRTLQNMNANNSPQIPLAIENQRLDNMQRIQAGPLGQLFGGWY
jgi:hypothetical protein